MHTENGLSNRSRDVSQRIQLSVINTLQDFENLMVRLHQIELLSDKNNALISFDSELSSNKCQIDNRFENDCKLAFKNIAQSNGNFDSIYHLLPPREGESLFSLLRYNPMRVGVDDNLLLLVVYQIICCLEYLLRVGVPKVELTVNSTFFNNRDYWVVLIPPNIKEVRKSKDYQSPTNPTCLIVEKEHFANVLHGWILKKVSNYDYLMYVNRLAGRRLGNPKGSAVLPWVTDFSSPSGNLRDLTKTKFRLTKGERQLDATFGDGNPPSRHSNAVIKQSVAMAVVDNHPTGCGQPLELFVPHHLLDMMPNLAYYTYMARQTSVELLERYVRPVYRPEEFPTSVQRLYANTPEECIPEFFTEPAVFTSIHSDMPDLMLPEWFSGSSADFLSYHRGLLESDEVSEHLHEWIDLTFGYKLLGEAAVAAKNVHLELVSSEPPVSSRVTCLFSQPHPRRALHSGELIGVYEEASSFLVSTCGEQPLDLAATTDHNLSQQEDDASKQQFNDLTCLIVELCIGCRVSGVLPDLENDLDSKARLRRARRLFKKHSTVIPSRLRRGLGILLSPGCPVYPINLLRCSLFHFPQCVIDWQRILIGLRGHFGWEALHFGDGPLPGVLLDVFLGGESIGCWIHDWFPYSLLKPLTSCLEKYVGQSKAVLSALVSGKLTQFYLAVDGKQAVEMYLMPLVLSLLGSESTFAPNLSSRLYSRRFIRSLLLATRLPTFLSMLLPPLVGGVISTRHRCRRQSSLERAECETSSHESVPIIGNNTEIDDEDDRIRVLRCFLKTFGISGGVVPTVAASIDSICWLATLLGPLVTNDHVIPHLLETLVRCYRGSQQLTPMTFDTPDDKQGVTKLNYRIPKSPLPMPVYTSGKIFPGDTAATGALRCLERLASLYGVQVILSIYIPFVEETVASALSTIGADVDSTEPSTATWDTVGEARLVSSLVFLQQFVTYLSAPYLMDCLQEPIISCLRGALNVCGRTDRCFPSGKRGRLALLYKTIDCIYVLGVRLGFELMRSQMTEVVQLLFLLFDRVVPPGLSGTFNFASSPSASPVRFFNQDGHQLDENEEDGVLDEEELGEFRPTLAQPSQAPPQPTLFVVKLDRHTSAVTVAKEEPIPPSSPPTPFPSTGPLPSSSPSAGGQPPWAPPLLRRQRPAVLAEVRATFTAELAHIAYTSIYRLAGGSHIEANLYNIDRIRKLVSEHEAASSASDPSSDPVRGPTSGPPKLAINTEYESRLVAQASSIKMSMSSSHLRVEWEEFLSAMAKEKSDVPRFLGKRLVTFSGHSGPIKCIVPLSNENSFITAGSDKTIQLYSLTTARKRSRITATPCTTSSRRRSTSEYQGSHSGSATKLLLPTSSSPSRNDISATAGGSGADCSDAACPASLVFTKHKKAVFAAAYLHFQRLVASTDGSLIIWDPVTGQIVSRFAAISDGENNQSMTSLLRSSQGTCNLPAPLTALSSTVAFRSTLLAGDDAGCLLVIDLRAGGLTSTAAVAQRFYAAIGRSQDVCPPIGRSSVKLWDCSLNNMLVKQQLMSTGALRSVAPMDNDNRSIVCGFSSGLMSVFDIRAGSVLATWRGHADSVSQIFSHADSVFSSVSSGDKTVAFWCTDHLPGGSLSCRRTSPPAPMTSITCITPSASSSSSSSSLLIGGPTFPTTTDASSVLPSSKCILGRFDDADVGVSSSAPAAVRVVGSLALGGGHLSAMAALPQTLRSCLLTGTTAGSLGLYY